MSWSSEAFNSAGNAFSSGVNVTVSNPTPRVFSSLRMARRRRDRPISTPPPRTPPVSSSGSSVAFTGYSAPVLCTATLTYCGWLCSWNTTTVPSGSYVLVSEAFNSAGSAFSSGVSISVNNPPSLVDLIGSFSGTTSYNAGTGGSSFEEQVFDATYSGSSAVGSVTLHLDGCVNG